MQEIADSGCTDPGAGGRQTTGRFAGERIKNRAPMGPVQVYQNAVKR
jgi:hypothetical protein